MSEEKKKTYHSNSNQTLFKPAKINLGNELEYRILRLFIYMGYWGRRSRPIYTINRLDQATDIDVFLMKWIEPFKENRAIIECKSGGSRPLDRVFWLSGVKNFVNAEEAILIRQNTKWNIKDFAKKCSVKILDINRINELEKIFNINSSEWPGYSDHKFLRTVAEEWDNYLKNNSQNWELYWTVTSEILYDEPFVSINYLMSRLRLMLNQNKIDYNNSAIRFMIAESITNIAICTMVIASRSFDLTQSDRIGLIKNGLTNGSLEPEHAERILKSSYNLAKQTVHHYVGTDFEIDESIFKMSYPPENEIIINIVEDIIKYYPDSLNFIQLLDLILVEQFVKRTEPKGFIKKIKFTYQPSTLFNLVKQFLSGMNKANVCPNIVLEIIDSYIKHDNVVTEENKYGQNKIP